MSDGPRTPAPSRRAFLAVAASLAAGGALTVSPRGARAQSQTPVVGGRLTYLEQQAHTNLYSPAGGFYPNGGVLNQITDKLTYQNPNTLKIEPWLAESWSFNPERTEYVFKLRKGVTFSDGAPLDAAAVAKNFDVYGKGNKELRLPVSEVINNYERSDVIDPLTVRFRFTRSSPGFLQGTSVIGSGIVSPATLDRRFEELGDATKIIGSGPFVVASEQLDRELVLAARKDYAWAPASSANQGRPYLDEIRYIVTSEDSVRIGALLAGQADVIRQVQAYDEQQVEKAGYRIYAAPTRGVNNSVVFRPDNPLVADVRVRRALLLATNTKEIVESLFSAHYPQATSVIASTAQGYVNLADKLGFDPEKARALLDEAGWTLGRNGLRQRSGQDLVLTAYESLPQPQNRATLQLIAQQWARVGVKLNVLAGDSGSRATDDLDPLKTPVSPAMVGRADPDVIKSQYHWENRDVLRQKPGHGRVKEFVDAKLNELLESIASEVNEEKRFDDVAQVQAYLLDQAYVIPIFEEPQAFAAAPYVQGIGFEAVGRPSFYNTWLARR
jgi:peptide/nickel transport system substrate-binding protein